MTLELVPIIVFWTVVNGMIYPVYDPDAVNVIIVLEPEVVIVGEPVVVPE